ncbi:sigma-E factor negative regulatory protein [Luteimonas sp. A482]
MTSVHDNETLQIVPDPDKLYVYHRQQLSAMLDGELSPDEAKFMLRRLQHDGELATCWERWQVCGDMLRGQRNDLLPADFAHRVAVAVGAGGAGVETVEPRRATRPRLARWGGGAAVAASVALMAVFATRQLPEAGLVPVAEPAPMVAAVAPPPLQEPGAAASASMNDDVSAAIADAADPAPAMPRAQPDATVAVAAMAVAAAVETPRRAAQRRRAARAQPASVEVARASVPAAIDDPTPPMSLASEDIAPAIVFPMPQAARRPWPRALLAPQGAFTVANGSLLPREPQFEPLLPRESQFDPVLPGGRVAPWLAPTPSEPQADATQP